MTLVASLAVPVYRWALAFAALATAQLQDLRQAMLAAVFGRAKRAAATLLLLAMQGLRVEPKFLTDLEGLRALHTFDRPQEEAPSLLENLPLNFAVGNITSWAPLTKDTLQRLG